MSGVGIGDGVPPFGFGLVFGDLAGDVGDLDVSVGGDLAGDLADVVDPFRVRHPGLYVL